MPNKSTGRYSVTQKYLMTRGQAINFPAQYFNTNFKRDEVYGVVIDIEEDTIIVEFGSNKNCRIPMQKSAIAAVEKPEDAVE